MILLIAFLYLMGALLFALFMVFNDLLEIDYFYELETNELSFQTMLWPIFIIPNLFILIKAIFNKRKTIWSFIKHNIQSTYKRAFKKGE